jgi:hypothetical protein
MLIRLLEWKVQGYGVGSSTFLDWLFAPEEQHVYSIERVQKHGAPIGARCPSSLDAIKHAAPLEQKSLVQEAFYFELSELKKSGYVASD